MRNGIILAGIAFAVALAVIVGNRLSNEAMAVVVGAVCGISASIPVSIGLVIASSHNWGRSEGPREIGYDYGAHRYTPQPPVVIVSPPQTQAPYGLPYPQGQYVAPAIAPMLGAPREFKIIGEE
jgi:hypothetical protein